MSRNSTRRVPPAAGRQPIEQHEIENFARRVFKYMTEKGFSQSDLAREIWGETTDARGYKVAKGRDKISTYLRGQTVPDPKNMQALAAALDVSVEDLAPDVTRDTFARENPEVSLTAVAGHPDRAYLVVNKVVPMDVAAKVLSILTAAPGVV